SSGHGMAQPSVSSRGHTSSGDQSGPMGHVRADATRFHTPFLESGGDPDCEEPSRGGFASGSYRCRSTACLPGIASIAGRQRRSRSSQEDSWLQTSYGRISAEPGPQQRRDLRDVRHEAETHGWGGNETQDSRPAGLSPMSDTGLVREKGQALPDLMWRPSAMITFPDLSM